MKKAFLLGCGSKWGENFCNKLISHGISVDLVSGSKKEGSTSLNVKHINWQELKDENDVKAIVNSFQQTEYDLVFFNQNTWGAPDEWEFQNHINLNQWTRSYWLNCQLPALMVQELNKANRLKSSTKIGWILSGLIDRRQSEYWKHAGYASCKYTNLAMLQGFSKYYPSIFFGLNPDSFSTESYDSDSEHVFNLVSKLTSNDSGKCFKKNGDLWPFP